MSDSDQPTKAGINPPVFFPSVAVIAVLVVFGAVFPDKANDFFSGMQTWLIDTFGWLYLGAVGVYLVFCIVLALSRFGQFRLGPDHSEPDFSYVSWFAMLFSAGMGIGLMFYGVSEPLTHFSTASGGTSYGVTYTGEPLTDGALPPGIQSQEQFEAITGVTRPDATAVTAALDADAPGDARGLFAATGGRTDWAPLGAASGDEAEAVRLGMAATIFHWGLHPWAIYAVVALALALFSYNKGLPLTIRSAFYPILGDRVWGWWGHIIDTLAVFATLFGLATSLGFGATQANAGLNELFGIPINSTVEVLLISGITAVALVSVLRGLDGGVKVLSEINMGLALLLLLFVLFAGPTLAILTGFVDYLGAYLVNLPALSNPVGREDVNFMQGWTSFYWAWWISWSPFVGMFIARVSRGRTVRPRLTRAMNMPTNGDQEIHHAQ